MLSHLPLPDDSDRELNIPRIVRRHRFVSAMSYGERLLGSSENGAGNDVSVLPSGNSVSADIGLVQSGWIECCDRTTRSWRGQRHFAPSRAFRTAKSKQRWSPTLTRTAEFDRL